MEDKKVDMNKANMDAVKALEEMNSGEINVNLRLPIETAEKVEIMYNILGEKGTKSDTTKMALDITYYLMMIVAGGGEILVKQDDENGEPVYQKVSFPAFEKFEENKIVSQTNLTGEQENDN